MKIVANRLDKFGAETLNNESFNAIILSFFKSSTSLLIMLCTNAIIAPWNSVPF